ncbi:MAG: trp RNA-binding attenuation protein MtrB [Cloacibacillus evryensis]
MARWRKRTACREYIAVKALENGSRSRVYAARKYFFTRRSLREGEVWIAQFTEHISAMKTWGLIGDNRARRDRERKELRKVRQMDKMKRKVKIARTISPAC